MKIIIFDLDGVIFDTTKLADEMLMKIYPTLTPEILKELACGNIPEGVQKYGLANKKIAETKEEEDIRIATYVAEKAKAPIFAGMKELIEDVHKKGYKLIINTSSFEQTCHPLLGAAGIDHFFDFVAARELSTSKVEKFKLIDERFGAAKEDTVFITDTVGDIKEAEIAGIPTIAVTWGAHNRDFFTRENYACLIGIADSTEELRGMIYSSNPL